ncbi:MAG TPA: hypothetical protein VF746_11705 [Longimicrobium sp.]
MQEVSTLRLYLLRGTYLLMVVGLGLTIWPLLLSGEIPEHMRGVVWSVLAAVSLLALLGIRYPLKMLPLLFFELVWKSVWVLAIGLPLWSSGQLGAGTAETMKECLMGVVFLVVIPWPYVLKHYVRAPSDPWRGVARVAAERPRPA